MKEKICLIAPYKELADLANQVKRDIGLHFTVKCGVLETGVKQAIAACHTGSRVIISRGGTAASIKKHVDVPVVEIKVTGYDILRAISQYRDTEKPIGIIGYGSVVQGCRIICDILGITMKDIIIDNEDSEDVDWADVQAKAHDLVRQYGIENMIGDSLVVSKLKFTAINVNLITSGKEAVLEAIEEARHIVQVREEERKTAERFETVINYVQDGIIATDEQGLITVINPAAEGIFHLRSAFGQSVKEIIKNTRIDKVLESGKAELAQLQKVPGGYILTNRVPIKVDGEIKGVVATFQEVEKIQDVEQKIRRDLYSKGLMTKYCFDDFLTEDPDVKKMLNVARNYAKTDTTVLIQGENGTGKEILAQGIHSESCRAERAFVAVNCAALPPLLLESELFGYVEGAFTGAKKGGKPGLFELAHKGTIFLDEIGDIDKNLQGRLLRVLEEKQVMRIGSDAIIPVDIRVIAATNRDLKALVAQGEFRMDLYYRLNVLNLRTIPLRERKRDIALLTSYFLYMLSEKYGRNRSEFPAQVVEWLTQYYWPGNVRELKNIVERVVLQREKERVSLETIRFMIEDLDVRPVKHKDNSENSELFVGTLKEIKRKVVLRILKEEKYNKSITARRLGVDRATVDRIIK